MPRKAARSLKATYPSKGGAPPIIQVVGGSAAAFVAPMALPGPPIMDPLSSTLAIMGANPYMIGIFYVFLNLGGRFLTLELTRRQEWFLSQPFMRPFILFSVMFIATRNLAVAFYTTVGVLSVLWLFANENSALCMIPGWRDELSQKKKEAEDKSYQDTMKAIKKHHHDSLPDEPPPEVITGHGNPEHSVPVPPVQEPPASNSGDNEHSPKDQANEKPDPLTSSVVDNDARSAEHREDLYH
jgi:hypothetical protein